MDATARHYAGIQIYLNIDFICLKNATFLSINASLWLLLFQGSVVYETIPSLDLGVKFTVWFRVVFSKIKFT